MKYKLTNGILTVECSSFGGQLTSIKNDEGLEYLWQGDPTYWGGQAPILFPICGSLRDDQASVTLHNGKEGHIQMPRHGIVRKKEFTVLPKSEHKIAFRYESNKSSLEAFPFHFVLEVAYTLEEDSILVEQTVYNPAPDQVLPYFIGGHPGFNCPLVEPLQFEDYYLQFDQDHRTTTPKVYPETGLLDTNNRKPLSLPHGQLPLSHDLFAIDAIVFDRLRSRRVSLLSKKDSHGVRLDFHDFPHLLAWSSANRGPFIALEPWSGLSTTLSENNQFENKANLRRIPPGQKDKTSYRITCF